MAAPAGSEVSAKKTKRTFVIYGELSGEQLAGEQLAMHLQAKAADMCRSADYSERSRGMGAAGAARWGAARATTCAAVATTHRGIGAPGATTRRRAVTGRGDGELGVRL
jgi:hypothetical protein